MDWIKSLGKSIDYIEENLDGTIDLKEAAGRMNVSEFYFHKIFTLVCGITPGEYVRNRKLAKAGSELVSENEKIIDIALKYGYDTPEGFARAFTRFHGASPRAVRAGEAPVRLYAPLRVSITMKGGISMNYRIIEKEPFYVLEKVETHTIIDDANKNTIPGFWTRAKADGTIEKLEAAMVPEENVVFGICYGNSASDNKTFEYSIAAHCDKSCPVPDGMRKTEISGGLWAVFECTGAMPDAIQNEWHKIITEFFPSSDYEPTYEMDIEEYPDGDMSADDYKSRIWVKIKKS